MKSRESSKYDEVWVEGKLTLWHVELALFYATSDSLVELGIEDIAAIGKALVVG